MENEKKKIKKTVNHILCQCSTYTSRNLIKKRAIYSSSGVRNTRRNITRTKFRAATGRVVFCLPRTIYYVNSIVRATHKLVLSTNEGNIKYTRKYMHIYFVFFYISVQRYCEIFIHNLFFVKRRARPSTRVGVFFVFFIRISLHKKNPPVV